MNQLSMTERVFFDDNSIPHKIHDLIESLWCIPSLSKVHKVVYVIDESAYYELTDSKITVRDYISTVFKIAIFFLAGFKGTLVLLAAGLVNRAIHNYTLKVDTKTALYTIKNKNDFPLVDEIVGNISDENKKNFPLINEIVGNISDFLGKEETLNLRLASKVFKEGSELCGQMNLKLTNWINHYLKKINDETQSFSLTEMAKRLDDSKVNVFSRKNITDLEAISSCLKNMKTGNQEEINNGIEVIEKKIKELESKASPEYLVAEENLDRLTNNINTLVSCAEGTLGNLWIDSKTGKIQAFWGHDSDPALFDDITEGMLGTKIGTVCLGGYAEKPEKFQLNFRIEINLESDRLSDLTKRVLAEMDVMIKDRNKQADKAGRTFVYKAHMWEGENKITKENFKNTEGQVVFRKYSDFD